MRILNKNLRYNQKRLKSSVSVFNHETGEFNEFYATLYKEGLKFHKFACMGLNAVWFLVKNDFSTSEYKLLFSLLSAMEPGNKVTFKMKEFSDEIGISAVSLTKSIKKLKEANIIFEVKKIGTYIRVFVVSPHILWRGDGGSHKEAIKAWPQPKTTGPIPSNFSIFG